MGLVTDARPRRFMVIRGPCGRRVAGQSLGMKESVDIALGLAAWPCWCWCDPDVLWWPDLFSHTGRLRQEFPLYHARIGHVSVVGVDRRLDRLLVYFARNFGNFQLFLWPAIGGVIILLLVTFYVSAAVMPLWRALHAVVEQCLYLRARRWRKRLLKRNEWPTEPVAPTKRQQRLGYATAYTRMKPGKAEYMSGVLDFDLFLCHRCWPPAELRPACRLPACGRAG